MCLRNTFLFLECDVDWICVGWLLSCPTSTRALRCTINKTRVSSLKIAKKRRLTVGGAINATIPWDFMMMVIYSSWAPSMWHNNAQHPSEHFYRPSDLIPWIHRNASFTDQPPDVFIKQNNKSTKKHILRQKKYSSKNLISA